VTSGGEVDAVPHDQVDRDHEIANRAIDDALAAANTMPPIAALSGHRSGPFQANSHGFVHRSAGRCFSASAARFLSPNA